MFRINNQPCRSFFFWLAYWIIRSNPISMSFQKISCREWIRIIDNWVIVFYYDKGTIHRLGLVFLPSLGYLFSSNTSENFWRLRIVRDKWYGPYSMTVNKRHVTMWYTELQKVLGLGDNQPRPWITVYIWSLNSYIRLVHGQPVISQSFLFVLPGRH